MLSWFEKKLVVPMLGKIWMDVDKKLAGFLGRVQNHRKSDRAVRREQGAASAEEWFHLNLPDRQR